MTRRTWLLVRDLLILAFTLWALIRAPQDVERLLAMYLPRVVDCTKPLQEGGHRLKCRAPTAVRKWHAERTAMMNLNDPWEAYLNDPKFHMLVDYMMSRLMACEFTPNEVRQAAMLAAMKLEMLNPHRQLFVHVGFDRPSNKPR